ncbi:hypothetical protein AC249_AIPGENE11481 [Exaiptasia diaphana]|nr:hypothetical protein AC249_AIPGENE11481 [Exaiptasia diaphana]
MRLQDIEKQNWHGELFNDERGIHGQRNKLRTFRLFKVNYSLEGYLTKVKQFHHRRALTKLRISNHDLEIEKGRYSGGYKKVEERKCFHCKDAVEDEKHFLIKCPLYSKIRDKFIKQNNIHDFIAEEEFFLKLIDPPKRLQTQAAKYIYDFALQINRDTRLSKKVKKLYKQTKIPESQSMELCRVMETIEKTDHGQNELEKITKEDNNYFTKEGIKAGDCIKELCKGTSRDSSRIKTETVCNREGTSQRGLVSCGKIQSSKRDN